MTPGFLILAQTSAPALTEEGVKAIVAFLFLAAIPVVLTCVEKVQAILGRARGNPPAGEKFATKAEVHALRTELSQDMIVLRHEIREGFQMQRSERRDDLEGIFAAINGIKESMTDVNRQLGRVEGSLQSRGKS